MPGRLTLLKTIALFLLAVTLLLTAIPDARASVPPRLTWRGQSWFASGANIPYFRWRCDFGCRANGGVLGRTNTIDRSFRRWSRNGVKVVRWYVFPGDAWQIRRGAGDAPLAVRTGKVYPDLDRAVRLAADNDIYLDLVLFSDLRSLPATWMSDAAQREQLADAVGPMFARYRRSGHVLSWEIVNEPERAVDDAHVTLADAQSMVRRMTSEVHARSRAHASLGPVSIDRVGSWTGLGLDFMAPHSFSNMDAPSCALCTTAAAAGAAYGVDVPIVIGALDPATSAGATLRRLRRARSHGYAGAWLWSLQRREHPSMPSSTRKIPLQAPWRLIYASRRVGPRARVLNPCLGPLVGTLRCPDLRMSPPSDLYTERASGRRTLLLSRNSINSMGTGPAELHGTRAGRYLMRAVQRIHRRRGRPLVVGTGARLVFKAIPGQYRYWKWKNAAEMQLWQLDGRGRPVRLMRRGPKTVYCLRDLKRTRPWLPRSPRSQAYPACSQNLHERARTLGTSVGWSDIYPSTYHENWINVTGLRGCYAYVHIVDPTNVMYESNEDNNRSSVTVRLPFTGSSRGCPNARPLQTGLGGGY